MLCQRCNVITSDKFLVAFLARYGNETTVQTTADLRGSFTMADHPIIRSVLSLIEKDESKVLHLTFGSRKVETGENIPKGGKLKENSSLQPCNTMLMPVVDLIRRCPRSPKTDLECALGTEVHCRQSRPRRTLPVVRALESRPPLATGRLHIGRIKWRPHYLRSCYLLLGAPRSSADQQSTSIHLLSL